MTGAGVAQRPVVRLSAIRQTADEHDEVMKIVRRIVFSEDEQKLCILRPLYLEQKGAGDVRHGYFYSKRTYSPRKVEKFTMIIIIGKDL